MHARTRTRTRALRVLHLAVHHEESVSLYFSATCWVLSYISETEWITVQFSRAGIRLQRWPFSPSPLSVFFSSSMIREMLAFTRSASEKTSFAWKYDKITLTCKWIMVERKNNKWTIEWQFSPRRDERRIAFLIACTRLYASLCPSVRPSFLFFCVFKHIQWLKELRSALFILLLHHLFLLSFFFLVFVFLILPSLVFFLF